MILLRVLVFALGIAVVGATLLSAVKNFLLPRGAPDQISRVVFIGIRRLFQLRLLRADSYLQRDRLMAFYTPISLLTLLIVWLVLILVGYTAMFWAAGLPSWYDAFEASGSSLFTLGFAPISGVFRSLLAFSEAGIGLTLAALLIAYLPSIYSAFQRREVAVSLLEVRAGQPPSVVEMIQRFHRIHGFGRLTEQWRTWEAWFADIEESHTSLAALIFLRSPQPDHSWITAAGAVLDTASFVLATIDIPNDPQAALCVRAGYLALRHISGFLGVSYHPNPQYPAQPISIQRAEFDAACERLATSGVPLKADLDQAWRDFAGWRVNYDAVLLALCAITMAPPTPWSSDRAPALRVSVFFGGPPSAAG
jgi:hypothetical protein